MKSLYESLVKGNVNKARRKAKNTLVNLFLTLIQNCCKRHNKNIKSDVNLGFDKYNNNDFVLHINANDVEIADDKSVNDLLELIKDIKDYSVRDVKENGRLIMINIDEGPKHWMQGDYLHFEITDNKIRNIEVNKKIVDDILDYWEIE